MILAYRLKNELVQSKLNAFSKLIGRICDCLVKEFPLNTAWKNKNLRLYFGGQLVSLIGTWMQQIALSWLVYRLTDSPFMLGLIAFTSQIPALFLTPVAGVVADNTNRHRLLLITQVLLMAQAVVLTVATWSGHTPIWQLVVLSLLLGTITAFELPTRQSFLFDMLEGKEQLASAIGINSSINTLTSLIGPFAAGLFVAWAGERMCFLGNALSYIAVIVALLFVKAKQRQSGSSEKSPFAQFKEGFEYTTKFAPIRDLVMFVALISAFSMPFAVLMPAFAKDVFKGNAMTLAFLTGSCSAGSLVGAFLVTSRKGTQTMTRWVVAGCALLGVVLILFGASTFWPLTLVAVIAAGFGAAVSLAGSNTVIQTIVDEDKRGRVMSFVVMAFKGMGPLGGIAAGALANAIGPGKTVMVTGLFTVLLAIVFRKRLARVHVTVTQEAVELGVSEAQDEMSAVSA